MPLLLELIHPRSVIDVGCGLGSWLAVAREKGVARVVGVDGEYLDRAQLEIPHDCFIAKDLLQPLNLHERFDLALSLEVGEHLPLGAARDFVASLIRLAPVVVFSAAAPFQGGTGHLNEQWPEYWARLFARHEFIAVDCLRRRLWGDTRVRYFYAQNTVIYVKRDRLRDHPRLMHEAAREVCQFPPSLVHPHLYSNALQRYPRNDPRKVLSKLRFGTFLQRAWRSRGGPSNKL
jgi:SAM-dependent methyltransferase